MFLLISYFFFDSYLEDVLFRRASSFLGCLKPNVSSVKDSCCSRAWEGNGLESENELPGEGGPETMPRVPSSGEGRSAWGKVTGEQNYSLHLPVTPPMPPSVIWFPQTTAPLRPNKCTLNKGILLLLTLLWRNKLECFTNSPMNRVKEQMLRLNVTHGYFWFLEDPNAKWHQAYIFSLIYNVTTFHHLFIVNVASKVL